MAKTRRSKRTTRRGRPNYVIIGKGGEVVVVSGATHEVSTLDKARSADVLKLVRARQRLGKRLTALLSRKGFVLSDQGIVHIEEDES